MKLLFLLAFITLVSPALAQEPTVTATPTTIPNAKFDWKLHLTKGQKWTQTTTIASTSEVYGAKFIIHMNLALQNEVLFANDNEYVIQCTFSRFEQTTGIAVGSQNQHEPDRSKFTRGFVGIPFKIKQRADGKIVAISGLEKLRNAGQKSIGALAESKAERQELEHVFPRLDNLKDTVTRYSELTLPSKPLALRESYSHIFEVYPSFDSMEKIQVKGTLRAFDGMKARFDERGTLSTFTNQPEFRRIGSDSDKLFEAFSCIVSGNTAVDTTTGLSQSTLNLSANIKTTAVSANGKRTTLFTKKQMQVSTEAKPDS